MDKKIFLEILNKYNRGKASEQEIDLLNSYYDLFEVEDDILDKMDLGQKQQLKQQIFTAITPQIPLVATAKIKQWHSRKWLAAAAVLVVLFSVGILFLKKEVPRAIVAKNVQKPMVIKPGTNQATLTLADGSTIGLNEGGEGVIVAQTGLQVVKSSDGEVKYESNEELVPTINTIATPRGGQYQLVLHDGTKVWLNAQSSIKFPTRFAGDARMVAITGEVYFEVAKNKEMPFQVRTQNQQIEVLGTHFNVNTYTDELMEKTTLIEGSVRVVKLKNGAPEVGYAKMLRPGQEASLTGGSSSVTVNAADTDAAISWKNGYFKFDKADIQTVMRQVSRWYDVDVKYVGKMSNDLFVGKIKRTEDITDVLRILQRSKINTTIKERTIIITN
ncbi:fec operon regulator FecR [compost metagenome]